MAFSAAFAAGPLLGTVLLERLGARPLWGVMFGLGALSATMMARVKTRPSS
jgi:MFS family permease